MSVPSGIIVGYLRGVSDGILGRVVEGRGWRMAHRRRSFSICSRLGINICGESVRTCGDELPLSEVDVSDGIVCLYFGTIVATEKVHLTHKAITVGIRWMWVYELLSDVGEGNGVNEHLNVGGRYFIFSRVQCIRYV